MSTIKSYGTIYMVHWQNLREVLYAALDTIQHYLGALDSKLPCTRMHAPKHTRQHALKRSRLEYMLPGALDSKLPGALDCILQGAHYYRFLGALGFGLLAVIISMF